MSSVATQQDITDLRAELKESFNDVATLLQTFMQQVDDRFTRAEREQAKTRQEIAKLLDYLDELLKKQGISDDERIVMGHQLDRLDKWTHELADRIGHKLLA
jgi:ElaB/YqjD/DUF883 family membrane-anchored ribosome-binding protein